MKSIWFTVHSVGSGRMQFNCAKKRLAEVKELNSLVANVVKEVLK